jgi:hypothetical protein
MYESVATPFTVGWAGPRPTSRSDVVCRSAWSPACRKAVDADAGAVRVARPGLPITPRHVGRRCIECDFAGREAFVRYVDVWHADHEFHLVPSGQAWDDFQLDVEIDTGPKARVDRFHRRGVASDRFFLRSRFWIANPSAVVHHVPLQATPRMLIEPNLSTRMAALLS